MDTGGMNWRKASYSGNAGAEACVEVASAEAVMVRDSREPEGFTMNVPAIAWQRFIKTL